MSRSVKKGPFVDAHLIKKVEVAIAEKGKNRSKPGRAVPQFCLSLLGLRLRFITVASTFLFMLTRTWSAINSASLR